MSDPLSDRSVGIRGPINIDPDRADPIAAHGIEAVAVASGNAELSPPGRVSARAQSPARADQTLCNAQQKAAPETAASRRARPSDGLDAPIGRVGSRPNPAHAIVSGSKTAPSQKRSAPIGIGAGEAGSDHSAACSPSRLRSAAGIAAPPGASAATSLDHCFSPWWRRCAGRPRRQIFGLRLWPLTARA